MGDGWDGQDGPSNNLRLISTHNDDELTPLTGIRNVLMSPLSRRTMLRATASAVLGASAALPRIAAPVAAADPQLVFGPQDGKLVNAATQIAVSRVAVTDADCVLNATFRNPYGADGSPSPYWSYGFGLRRNSSGTAGAYIYVRSDYKWGVIFLSVDAQGKTGFDDSRERDGTLPDLRIGANATNDMQVIVSGGTAELLVNGVDIAAIDLGDLRNPGNVSIATGVDQDSTVAGTTTDYLQFQVFSPAPPPTPFASRAPMYLYGPANGGLRHTLNPDTVDSFTTGGLRLQDGTISVRFFNPYDAGVGAFDYGFEFRNTNTSFYRLTLLSDQTYILRYRMRQSTNIPYGPAQTIQQGNIANMNIGNGEANDMVVQMTGAKGALLVGGMQVATLDLSKGVVAGGVNIGTGFITDEEQMGAVTRYENFTIARLT